MNLAVHGLSGDIREANSYYDDPHKLVGRFDFVMANPPFNQSEVDRAKLVNDAGQGGCAVPARAAYRQQRQLPLDQSVLRRAEPDGPRWLRHGEQRLGCGRQRARAAAEADRDGRGGLHRRGRPEHVLHGDPAGDAVVPRQGQGERADAGTRCCSSMRGTSSGR